MEASFTNSYTSTYENHEIDLSDIIHVLNNTLQGYIYVKIASYSSGTKALNSTFTQSYITLEYIEEERSPNIFYIKQNDTWSQITINSVYKKQNAGWAQYDVSNLQNNERYIVKLLE